MTNHVNITHTRCYKTCEQKQRAASYKRRDDGRFDGVSNVFITMVYKELNDIKHLKQLLYKKKY